MKVLATSATTVSVNHNLLVCKMDLTVSTFETFLGLSLFLSWSFIAHISLQMDDQLLKHDHFSYYVKSKLCHHLHGFIIFVLNKLI